MKVDRYLVKTNKLIHLVLYSLHLQSPATSVKYSAALFRFPNFWFGKTARITLHCAKFLKDCVLNLFFIIFFS